MNYKTVEISVFVKKASMFLRKAYGTHDGRKTTIKPSPLMLTRFGKPYVLITRYSDDFEKLDAVKKGAITWEDFRKEMMEKGWRDLVSGESKVKVADVVQAEKVQTEKDRLKLETAGFMLEAAKYFSGHLYICPNCNHQMLPESIEQDYDQPVKELSDSTE